MKKVGYNLYTVFGVLLLACKISGDLRDLKNGFRCRETAEILGKTRNHIFEVHCRYPCLRTDDKIQVWGTNIFSLNSSVCKSALHDLRISIWNTNARDVQLSFKHFKGVNMGSVRFGYMSKDLNAVNETFVFEFVSPRITERIFDIVSVHEDFLHGKGENHTQSCFVASNAPTMKMNFQPFKKRNLLEQQQFAQSIFSIEGNSTAFEYTWSGEESVEHTSGGFECIPEYSTLSSVTSIAFRSDAFFLPHKFSITANINDTVVLTLEEQEKKNFAQCETIWMRDGKPLNRELFKRIQRTSITINISDTSFAGIYSLGYKNYSSLRRGFIRLIVRTCPNGKFGSSCSENCPHCLNGGVCHDLTGVCICAPGFNGTLCEKACFPGYFGNECNLQCSVQNEEQEFEACIGKLLCLPDPYGCTCAAGLSGHFCNESCPPGFYGANCNEKQVGHCEEGNYSVYSGLCENACADGWHGIYCNESYPVLTHLPQLLNVSKFSIRISFEEWTNETGIGYGTPKYYQVIYKEMINGSWQFGPLIDTLEGTKNYEVEIINLLPGKQYFVAVIVRDISGNAQKYDLSMLNVTTVCDRPLSPPTNIQFYTDGRKINLKWKVPPAEKWNCWDIESVIILNESQSNISIKNTTKGSFYSFLSDIFMTWQIQICLSPMDERSEDIICSDFKTVTVKGDVPGAPETGFVFQETDSSFVVKWKEPMIKNNLTKYKITLLAVDSFNISYIGYKRHIVLNEKVRTFLFDNLLPATSFTLLIQAGNEAGFGIPLHLLTSTKKTAPVISIPFEILKSRGPEVVIKLASAETSGISISAYFIVIVPVITNDSLDHIISDNIYHVMSCSSSINITSVYVAGKINYVPQNGTCFTIGTGVCENGYYNPPLKFGMTYKIGISALLLYGQESLISDINYIPELLKIEVSHPQKAHNILGISFSVLIPLSTVLVIGVLFYYYKKYATQNFSDLNVKFFSFNETTEHEFSACNEALDEMAIIETESVCEDLTNRIAVKDLLQYLKNNIQNNKIKDEFLRLPKGQIYPCNTAKMSKNKPKNRYGNILPYDHSRVILDVIDNDPHSDYIHASYIDGYKKSKKYIATQGPVASTIIDFWRMVWKENSSKILMTTNLVESGKVKCEKYWPDEADVYGNIFVEHQCTYSWADFTVRTFCISKGEESREIKHYHFTTWPDHGVPSNTTPFVNFLRKARAYDSNTEGPVVIHCSAGIGRTGTIILLDSMIEMGQKENHVDPLEQLCAMRRQRMNIVENFDQYLFVHYALVEELCIGQTSIKCDVFKNEYRNSLQNEKINLHLQKQFQMLNELCPHLLYKDMQAAYLLENQEKNRYMHILPADSSRPFLPRNYENTGYINAVFVDGYRWKNAYIATQYPLPQTIVDFWSMIYEIKSTVIVLLQDIDIQDSKNPQLWPSSDLEVFGNLQVECQSVKTEDNTIVRELYLRIPSEMEEKEPLPVNIFQVLNWPVTDNLPSDTSSLLSVLKKVNPSQCKLPITVICLDGATACGIFCAALYLCDRIQSDQEVDIFQAVKCIRVNRPQFISNEGQYIFLFQFIKEYLSGSLKDFCNPYL